MSYKFPIITKKEANKFDEYNRKITFNIAWIKENFKKASYADMETRYNLIKSLRSRAKKQNSLYRLSRVVK